MAREREPATDELVEVLTAYGFGDDCRAAPIEGGLINHTVRIDRGCDAVAIVQRLHPIFAAEVNVDLDALTTFLAERGMDTPRLLRTQAGARWVEVGGAVWRALSFVDGDTIHRIDDPAQARAAGELVGRFHAVVEDFRHDYAFTRAGVHDTPAHLARLRQALSAPRRPDEPEIFAEARALGRELLSFTDALPALDGLPLRHCHGDLKISNVLFSAPTEARCLIDLDTLGRHTIAYELGDALRSWCNTSGEDVAEPVVDVAVFAAAMDGYRSGAGDLLTAAERASIVPGVETICAELTARFCVDVFDDRYFGWDSRRFASRRHHNLVRARGQLALARSVRERRAELSSLV